MQPVRILQSVVLRSRGIVLRSRGMCTSHNVILNYQQPPPPGKSTGRYIDQPDLDDMVDENEPQTVKMHNARVLQPPAELEKQGFTLRSCPTGVKVYPS